MTMKGENIQAISNAEFPRDLPSDLEENIIVIVCESDSINWSFHEGAKHNFAPTVFWTTPHVQEEDRSPPPCMSLTRFLCQHALSYIFGGVDLKSATKHSASRAAAKRKIPSITVYMLSNSTNHEDDISFLFKDVPTRLFRLRNTDFFTSQQLGEITKPLISVGQFAAMFAAKEDYGSPILLLNGGSAITYMGMDIESKLLGGGACPGMSIRCRTLFDYCSKDFPTIDFDKYKQITDKAKFDKKPISIFASNMEVGIAANATAELAGQLRNIVKQFLKAVGPLDTPVTVVITGDDTETLEQLLKENCSDMIETEPDVKFPSSSEVTFCVRKNMVPYGVQHLLAANKRKRSPLDPDEEIREALVGLRAATCVKNSNSSKTILRGSIGRVFRGKIFEEDSYLLLLDDGEKIVLDLLQLYDAMALYAEVGEETNEANKELWVGEKREALSKVQGDLEGNNDKIKKRKIELDAAKKKNGSIIKTVCPEEKSRSPKRQKSSAKNEEDDHKKYIGQRIAKFFDDPTPENPDNQIIYFGTIDRLSADKSLWHIKYDDDDEEEFDFSEIRAAILLHAKNRNNDVKNLSG